MPIQSKAFSGPVKSIPKDFSDADPVEDIPRPSLVQLNRFLKIFLKQIQSIETKSVKSIPKDFSEVKPVNRDKIRSQFNTCNKPGKYPWTTDCRLIPETSKENYLHEEIED